MDCRYIQNVLRLIRHHSANFNFSQFWINLEGVSLRENVRHNLLQNSRFTFLLRLVFHSDSSWHREDWKTGTNISQHTAPTFYPEDGGSMFLRNFQIHLPHYPIPRPRTSQQEAYIYIYIYTCIYIYIRPLVCAEISLSVLHSAKYRGQGLDIAMRRPRL